MNHHTLILHTGALGDHILLWPLLRTLLRAGNTHLTIVARQAHAELSRQILGQQILDGCDRLHALDLESPVFNALWRGPEAVTSPDLRIARVLTTLTDDSDAAGQRWWAAAKAQWPRATIEFIVAPGAAMRRELWNRERVHELGRVQPSSHPPKRIILFIGAGGPLKRWPVERWCQLATRLASQPNTLPVAIVLGPVERERLSKNEFAEISWLSAQLPSIALIEPRSLPELAALLSRSLYIGADTGPTHLAAQIGVPTLALFGPTDPVVWSPVGPRVRVLAPVAPQDMQWLSVDTVFSAAMSALADTAGTTPSFSAP